MMEYDEGFVLLIFISSSYVSCVKEKEIFFGFYKRKMGFKQLVCLETEIMVAFVLVPLHPPLGTYPRIGYDRSGVDPRRLV